MMICSLADILRQNGDICGSVGISMRPLRVPCAAHHILATEQYPLGRLVRLLPRSEAGAVP